MLEYNLFIDVILFGCFILKIERNQYSLTIPSYPTNTFIIILLYFLFYTRKSKIGAMNNLKIKRSSLKYILE